MTAPIRTGPPYVPVRRGRWPVGRTPRGVILAIAALLAVAVLVGLAHRPTQAQRATDLRLFVTDMRYDIQSCAGGVSESLTGLRQLTASDGADARHAEHVRDTIKIATYGAGNCSPANSMQIEDLEQYQVSESLARFRLDRVVTGLTLWATQDAAAVQTDVATVLAAHGLARSQAMTALRTALTKLDARRSALDVVLTTANNSLDAHARPLQLPG